MPCNSKSNVITATDADFNWPIRLAKDVKNFVYSAGKRLYDSLELQNGWKRFPPCWYKNALDQTGSLLT